MSFITKAEMKHAKAIGSRFDDALARATMIVRSSDKLVGLDKVRAPIAWRAALKATGYEFEVDGFVFPRGIDADADLLKIASDLYECCVASAKLAMLVR